MPYPAALCTSVSHVDWVTHGTRRAGNDPGRAVAHHDSRAGEQFQQPRLQGRVGRNKQIRARWATRGAGNDPSGFGDDQPACSQVPRVEPDLEEAIQSAVADQAEVDSGAAQPAEVTDSRQHPGENLGLAGSTLRLVAEPGADQRAAQLVLAPDVHRRGHRSGPPRRCAPTR